ncbi:tripartite tricarboxylate transporter TctB family protein [Arvimicrobium flavum]|uniref:tripartite tricarboxylate transporter TctB family protein n=1 Tax=Arvimicrobium flavum TaxID=3393320 RepID=UPI00237A5677|nr:tripartite tricarboxylate transporter TctB family protein [Mesorhizobium shangrilense]
MTTRLADRLFLAGFILAGCYYLFESYKLAAAFPGAGFGPAQFPIMLGVLLIILCGVQVVVSFKRDRSEAAEPLELPNAGRLALTIILSGLFFLLWAAASQFYVPAALFFFALIMVYAPERKPRTAAVAAAVAGAFTASLYLIFELALGVSLA